MKTQKPEGVNPIDWFFGAMMMCGKERQFEYFHLLKPHWYSIQKYKDLYSCLEHCVEQGKDFNALTCGRWFNENGKLSKQFSIADIAGLTKNVGFPAHEEILICISETEQQYFAEYSFHFHNKIGQLVNGQNFDIEKIRSEVDKFQKQLDEAYIEEIELTNEDLVNEVIENHDKAKSGEFQGMTIGFNSLKHVLLEYVDFMVIGARPSMGKTAFVMSAIFNLIFLMKKRVVFYSLEMSKIQIMRRLISIGTGIPDERIKLGLCTDEELLRIEEFKKHPELSLLTIYEGSHKATDIIRKTAVLSKKEDVDLCIIDYLQKISPPRSGMKMMEIVSDASNQMKNLSMNLKIPTVALAQLSRSVETRGGDKRPVLSDLRESGEIEQDATIVAFLHRPEYYGITIDESGESLEGIGEFILAKNRGGKIGSTKMKFEGELMKWSDYNHYIPMNTMPVNNKFDAPEKKSEKNNDLPF